MNASNVHVRSDEHLTTVVGVDDVIVITTQDAVLVLNKAHGDQVKQLVDRLKTENRPEALAHKRCYRPWGYYQSVDSGSRYQVKRIVVKPGERLSLQKHFHRAEHWIVVKGTRKSRATMRFIWCMRTSRSICRSARCIEWPIRAGSTRLIEVQTGSYLGEDDIVRIQDVYNRG